MKLLYVGLGALAVLAYRQRATIVDVANTVGAAASDVVAAVNGIDVFANAIASAEGYNADPTNAPTRANNPGSLKLDGYPTTGTEGISVFPTPDAGWYALLYQLGLVASGASHNENVSMSIGEFAAKWTDTQMSAWANNVLAYLQANGFPTVSLDTPLSTVFA